MATPIERFKDSYSNWRYNPFTGADMAVDKSEDGLYIPGSSPFVVQLLEVPRKNDPTSVSVRAYDTKTDVDQNSASGQAVLYVASTTGFSADDKIIINRGGLREEEGEILSIQAGISLALKANLTYTHTAAQADDVEKYIEFTESGTSPAQSQFRVDYPPADGEGTGLVEFNQLDAGKEVRVDYKATGSPMLEEFLDTKVSYPAGSPATNQILGFVSGAPDWRYNPVCYFHDDNIIYHASGEDASCLLFRFKRSSKQATVILELKGAGLHQGYYTELVEHTHGVGTLDAAAAPNHNHGVGSLAGSQPTHTHGVSGNTQNTSLAHTHSLSLSTQNTSTGTGGYLHSHVISGNTGAWNIANLHNHSISLTTGPGGGDAVAISGSVADGGGHDHALSGDTASAGTTPKTYPDQLKIYINGVDKTVDVLALTGLTQFGDGTAGHAFVTTGSGEMDISALIVAAQIHELKITEPISAKGGRCLLHLEVY